MTTLNARTVVIAAATLQARRDDLLAQAGIDFVESRALATVAAGATTPAEVAATVVTTNVIDEAQVSTALKNLATAGLVSDEPLTATPEGQALDAKLNAAVARSAASIFDGIDEDDLAAASRVLALVTKRASQSITL